MNLKPFDYDNYVLTLPDVISNYFPRSDVNRIRHVLQNMFKITLYKGNVYVFFGFYNPPTPCAVISLVSISNWTAVVV